MGFLPRNHVKLEKAKEIAKLKVNISLLTVKIRFRAVWTDINLSDGLHFLTHVNK